MMIATRDGTQAGAVVEITAPFNRLAATVVNAGPLSAGAERRSDGVTLCTTLCVNGGRTVETCG